ncbi:MAG: outer membrane lipoprotein-sorting protein [Verrucomicrobiota bacterium JB023]|nr:outer membrane lipoprotein-sorting protein [Verrucomicrobiota bacterium JB023]
MKNLMKQGWFGLMALVMTVGAAPAQQPSADEILATARYVATLQQTSLNGKLRRGNTETPILLTLVEGQGIEFQVWTGKVWQKFQLKLGANQYDLFEGVGSNIRKFDTRKLNQPVMNTDLTYEDLAFAFLYWPNGKVLGEENLGIGRDAWRVRLVNPRAKGLYKTVDVWVHKKSGALMKIYGYRADGKCIKTFEVTDIMNVGGGEYSIKKMKVQSYNDAGRSIGVTYLEFDKPERAKPQGLR